MIETLRIERIAVVEEAEIEFGPGLNVLTGETGAGKSIVLGALSLLAGGRASADAVREGADSGTVEAVFRTDGLPELEAELSERGIESDGSELVVHRSVSRTGRARARAGGQLVPVALLAELFGERLEISSQHSSQALRRPESHARLLDAAGGLLATRESIETGVAQLRAWDRELADLRAAGEERERRRDFLRFQVGEIDEAELEPGEIARTESLQRRLAHAERLRQEGGAAWSALAGDATPGAVPATDAIAGAIRTLDPLAGIDEGLAGPLARLRELDALLRDAAADLERALDGVEADPAQLAQVDERLAQLERLRRKYGRDEQEILDQRETLAAELASLEGADERADAIEVERAAAAAGLAEEAAKLSEARAVAAKELAGRVEGSLHELGMPRARFEVALEPAPPPEGLPCGPTGHEIAVFRFAANPGERPRPLHKVASGGELSRVFLALKTALRRAAGGMVLVFDEVDAGVGGSAAERVGRALAELAQHHQVLCITHLPQIAALADVHFRVAKAQKKRRTHVDVTRIEGEARVDEIARMAGGEKISAATRRHAESLLRSR